MTSSLSPSDMRRLFALLNDELQRTGVHGELYLVGGAVMCLAYDVRASTRGVDGLFRPPREVREAATRVAMRAGLDADWLNDGVKRYLGERAAWQPFLELSHLRILTAQPDYLLAMKCLAFRIGAEFHDEDDIRYLLRHLDIRSYEQALATLVRYYPLERFPQKTLYALEELLERTPPKPG